MEDFVQFVLTDGSRIARFSGTACPLLVDAVTLPLRGGGGGGFFFFCLRTFKSEFLEFLKA